MHSKLLFSVYNNYLLLNIWVLYMWEPLWVVILEYLHIFLGAFKIDPLVWNYSWIIIPFIYPFLCNYWLLPCNFFYYEVCSATPLMFYFYGIAIMSVPRGLSIRKIFYAHSVLIVLSLLSLPPFLTHFLLGLFLHFVGFIGVYL